MNLVVLAMELILVVLALVGGYAVAGWIGVVVAASFFITMIADATIRSRSPKARALRAITRELRDAESIEFHIYEVRQQPTANPNNQAHPSTDDEG